MEFFKKSDIFVIFLAAIFFIACGGYFLSSINFLSEREMMAESKSQDVAETSEQAPTVKEELEPEPEFFPPPTKLENPPEIIKAVYLTGWSAGSGAYLNYLSNLLDNTEINAVVIDIKDYSGLISYESGKILDINALVRFLHNKSVYVMGRISVFEDPSYAKIRPDLAIYNEETKGPWQDNKGLSWMDPASKDVWDYNIGLAREVFLHGFDEVNFDYVRFPSDGNMALASFPVWDEQTPAREVIKEFFQYVRASLPDEKISVDLFGLTTVNRDDLGIGQVIEDAFLNFDYVCPMVYPSHYANGFIGFANPAEHPYEVIKYSLDSALVRKNSIISNGNIAELRPWLQDFDLGTEYTAEMIKQEIQATKDALGADYLGYMMWSPSNVYTQEAIVKQTE